MVDRKRKEKDTELRTETHVERQWHRETTTKTGRGYRIDGMKTTERREEKDTELEQED